MKMIWTLGGIVPGSEAGKNDDEKTLASGACGRCVAVFCSSTHL
jgi:hypothetical protein